MDSKANEKRSAVVLATIFLKQEIILKSGQDDNFKYKIRAGTTVEERENKVEKFPLIQACKMLNFESQKNKELPYFGRVEQNHATGKYFVAKYDRNAPEVSIIRSKAENEELEYPDKWDEEFRPLMHA